MRCFISGVRRVKGVAGENSKNPGRPFDFALLHALVPVENRNTENVAVMGHGFQEKELPLSVDKLGEFAKLTYPVEVELTVETVMAGQGFRTEVTGFRK